MTAPQRPTVCFCSLAFRSEPIETIIPTLAEMGYDGVEIFAGHLDGKSDDDLDRIRHLADDCGLQIPVVSPYFWLTRDLPDLIEQSLRNAERMAHCARRLGASRIRTFVDAGPDGIGSAQATDEHWQRAISNLQRITAIAPDLLFTVETHQWTLADTPESTQRLLGAVDRPNLVVLYQSMEADPLRGYHLLRNAIHHIHLQNPHGAGGSGYLDDGVSPLLPLLSSLIADGYAGTMSVEYCWKGVTWPRAASGRAWLRQHGF